MENQTETYPKYFFQEAGNIYLKMINTEKFYYFKILHFTGGYEIGKGQSTITDKNRMKEYLEALTPIEEDKYLEMVGAFIREADSIKPAFQKIMDKKRSESI
jgi:hypothetical protein